MNTITSLNSSVHSRQKYPINEPIYLSRSRPLLSKDQHNDFNHINDQFSSTILNTNTVSLSSPMSRLPSSSSLTSFTCPKSHEESLSPLVRSSLNQYSEFTSQTSTSDALREHDDHSTATDNLTTMSMSLNHHHQHQTYSTNTIITSTPTMTINHNGLKQQRDQTES